MDVDMILENSLERLVPRHSKGRRQTKWLQSAPQKKIAALVNKSLSAICVKKKAKFLLHDTSVMKFFAVQPKTSAA